ncbi:hypothetical protein GCM10009582_21100 [Arthrobacter flavus]
MPEPSAEADPQCPRLMDAAHEGALRRRRFLPETGGQYHLATAEEGQRILKLGYRNPLDGDVWNDGAPHRMETEASGRKQGGKGDGHASTIGPRDCAGA